MTVRVGVNAWGWEPWGLSFAAGMALHDMDRPGRWCAVDDPWRDGLTHAEKARLYPDNPFIQNAEEADRLILLHRVARAMPCHDRPEPMARLGGAYNRDAVALCPAHAFRAMEATDGD